MCIWRWEPTFNRTYWPRLHSFWPKLPAHMFCSVPRAYGHIITFLFFEGPKGRYGPREAWAHMGWVGHPAH